jgi:glycosyltransferase involved in cell wall biosynthesis
MWPDVKKAVPQAELHIFYGWQLFERFYANNPASMSWKEKMDKMMESDGITHHGRIPQPELKAWHEKCGLWAYPTHFGEINCISAMKSQAWGSIPVYINYAALQTTVKYGWKVEGDIYEPEVQEKFKKALISALQDHKKQESIRKPMMAWAKIAFSWENTAKQWSNEFKQDDLKEAMDIILKKDQTASKYMPIQLQRKHKLKETA